MNTATSTQGGPGARETLSTTRAQTTTKSSAQAREGFAQGQKT